METSGINVVNRAVPQSLRQPKKYRRQVWRGRGKAALEATEAKAEVLIAKAESVL